jgi:hypothetical protein
MRDVLCSAEQKYHKHFHLTNAQVAIREFLDQALPRFHLIIAGQNPWVNECLNMI